MRLSFFLVPLVLCTAACSSWEEGWTDEHKRDFLQACKEGNGRNRPDPDAYCNCVLEKTMVTYPTIATLMENRDSVLYRRALETCDAAATQ